MGVLKYISFFASSAATARMLLKVVNKDNEPIEGATCRVLNAIGGNNNVLSFDGVDDYILHNPFNVLANASAFSIEGWLKTDKLNTYLFWRNSGFLAQIQSNGTLRFRFFLNGAFRSNFEVAIPTNEWFHFGISWDGTNTIYAINGVEIINSTADSSHSVMTNNSMQMTIGQRDNGSWYRGQMAELRFWTVAKTAAQFAEKMNMRLVGDETGLAAYYPLNEGEGTTSTDNSGSNNGTIYGATWQESDESFPLFDYSIQGYDTTTPYDTGTTNVNGLTTLNYQINTVHGLEVTLPGKRRFIMPFKRTERGLLDWQVMLSDYLATFATDRGNILINSEPENNDANFLIE